MKLFGNKKNPARIQGRQGPDGMENEDGQKKGRLSGLQKGCLLLAASLMVLALTVFGVYKHFVKPMERPQNDAVLSADAEQDLEDEDRFTPPTTTEVKTQINQMTGEEEEVVVEVPASHKEGFYNILIVGTDDDGTRTDTILIARIDTVEHSVALLSVPRDTLVGTSGNNKINSIYGLNGKNTAGMEALKKSLARLLGFEVDGYALVDLDAFVELVDLVGGVDFNVPQRMYYIDPTQDLYIDLYAGEQHLDGAKAMQLVRFRGYAAADIQRTKVQQDFLKALAKKCLSVTTLTKVGGLADIFSQNVLTDLTVGNIAYFGQELLKCDFDQMYTHTLEGEGLMLNGSSVWCLYLNKTLEVVNTYFNPYEADITAANVSFRSPEYMYATMTPAASGEEEDTDTPDDTGVTDETETPDVSDGTELPDDSGQTLDPLMPVDPFADSET